MKCKYSNLTSRIVQSYELLTMNFFPMKTYQYSEFPGHQFTS